MHMNYAINNSLEKLKSLILLENIHLTNSQYNKIDRLFCWLPIDNKNNFVITDIVKGLVSKYLGNLLIEFGLSPSVTSNLILAVLHGLQLNLKQFWVDRCKKVVDKEVSLNIDRKQKKKVKKDRMNLNNLVFFLVNYVDSGIRATKKYELYKIWCAYSCNYGNSWQDF